MTAVCEGFCSLRWGRPEAAWRFQRALRMQLRQVESVRLENSLCKVDVSYTIPCATNYPQ